MIKKYYHLLLAIILVAVLVACEDSLGTDPDYKTTIVERDTIFRIDTVITIDTVKSSDSTEYIFTIDSLIIIRDSLGVTIDSLTQVIRDIKTRTIAPRFSMKVDSIIPLVTYEGQDTLLDINLQPVVIRSNKISKLFPAQNSINKYSVEMDTNLSMNRAWVDFSLDGRIDLIDTTIHFQQVYLDTSYVHIDSVHIFNEYSLTEVQNNFTHNSIIVDYNYNNITQNTQKDVSIKFEDYIFDSKPQIIGYTILIKMGLEARNTQLQNPKSNYQFRIFLRYP